MCGERVTRTSIYCGINASHSANHCQPTEYQKLVMDLMPLQDDNTILSPQLHVVRVHIHGSSRWHSQFKSHFLMYPNPIYDLDPYII
jgi:hypothetical protein